jgi:integrase
VRVGRMQPGHPSSRTRQRGLYAICKQNFLVARQHSRTRSLMRNGPHVMRHTFATHALDRPRGMSRVSTD